MRVGRVRQEAGQALIEMALILPVLLILALGIVEFGRAFNAKQVVTDAAREGARLAVVNDPAITQDSVTASVRRALTRGGMPGAAATVAFNNTTNWRTPVGGMQTVYVSIPYRFGFFGPFAQLAYGSATITLAARVSMRIQP